MKMQHLAQFKIAGFSYYEGAFVFRKLKIGTKLKLQLEEENKYDCRAVAIYYKKHKIGFIPKTENRIFYKLIQVGLAKHITTVIQQVTPHEHPENQIQIVAHFIN